MKGQHAMPRWQPLRRIIRVPSPALGADFSFRNPFGALLAIRGITLTLTTDATVGQRSVRIWAQSGDDVIFRCQSYFLQSVGDARHYVAFTGSVHHTGGELTIFMDFPSDGVWLPPGGDVLSQVQNIKVGDQISAIVLDCVEYPETLPSHLMPGPSPYAVSDE